MLVKVIAQSHDYLWLATLAYGQFPHWQNKQSLFLNLKKPSGHFYVFKLFLFHDLQYFTMILSHDFLSSEIIQIMAYNNCEGFPHKFVFSQGFSSKVKKDYLIMKLTLCSFSDCPRWLTWNGVKFFHCLYLWVGIGKHIVSFFIFMGEVWKTNCRYTMLHVKTIVHHGRCDIHCYRPKLEVNYWC